MTVERTLVTIRERSMLDLMDLSLKVVRGRPLVLGVAALAGIAPLEALNEILLRQYELPGQVWFMMVLIEIPLATAPLTIVLGGLMFGRKPRVREVLASLFRGLWPLFVYQLLLRGILLSSFVLAIMIPTRLVFANEVVFLERTGGGVWKRSRALTREREAELLGHATARVVFGALFVICFWLGAMRVMRLLFETELPDFVSSDTPGPPDPSARFAIWFVIAFFTVTRFLTYIDQRIRLEGWAVRLRLRAVGATMEGEDRW